MTIIDQFGYFSIRETSTTWRESRGEALRCALYVPGAYNIGRQVAKLTLCRLRVSCPTEMGLEMMELDSSWRCTKKSS